LAIQLTFLGFLKGGAYGLRIASGDRLSGSAERGMKLPLFSDFLLLFDLAALLGGK
jgi:hypothetical protein